MAEALLDPEPRCPAVLGLDDWPGILATLWDRLWPAARPAFSARVAVSPPQGGESVAPPWLYCVPTERAAQWGAHRVVRPEDAAVELSRSASWWASGGDATLGEVLRDFALTADLTSLRRAARAADRLDDYRTSSNARSALDLLRTLVALDASAEGLSRLKNEALDSVHRLEGELPGVVLSLANLEPATLPAGRVPSRPVTNWIDRHAAVLGRENVSLMLSRLRPGGSEGWWREAVTSGLATGFARLDRAWAGAAVQWLAWPEHSDIVNSIIPTTAEVELALLDAARGESPIQEDQHPILRAASARGWSRLHAWILARLHSPAEAIRRQSGFGGDPLPGLQLLVEELPGATIVASTISSAVPELTKLCARRTIREPGLLRDLDPTIPGWRALWEAHMEAGGDGWPPGCDRLQLAMGLLDSVIDGAECSSVVSRLAPDLAQAARSHPHRAELWQALDSAARHSLLPHVADELVRALQSGSPVAEPEPALAVAVVQAARRARPSAHLISTLAGWSVALDEREFIRWLGMPGRRDWPPVAVDVGRGVLRRGWRQAAKELYNRSKWVSELEPAAVVVQELLDWWSRGMLLWRSGGAQAVTDATMLARRIADLGAELAPERLDDLWERADGERRRLPSRGAPDERWRAAARLAHGGALEGGLAALVNELLVDFPRNGELLELRQIIARGGR